MKEPTKNDLEPNADGEGEPRPMTVEPFLDLVMEGIVAALMARYLRGDDPEGVSSWMFWHFGILVVRCGPDVPIDDLPGMRLPRPLPITRAGMKTGFDRLVFHLWPDPPAAAAWAADLAKRKITAAYSTRPPSEGRVEGADYFRPAGLWGSQSKVHTLEEAVRGLIWLTPFIVAGEIPEVN
jgi:hypothetical protein